MASSIVAAESGGSETGWSLSGVFVALSVDILVGQVPGRWVLHGLTVHILDALSLDFGVFAHFLQVLVVFVAIGLHVLLQTV